MTKKIGVIGLGSIGMRHAKNLLGLGVMVQGYDPVVPVPYDVGPLNLDLSEVDGVVIASPTNTHAKYLALAKQAQKPIFVEKPLSDSLDIPSFDGYPFPVVIGNNLRFHSCVKQAKLWLRHIGKPLWASFTVSQYNNKYTDPCILNWGAHEFDLVLHLLGPATVTAAVGDQKWSDVCLLHEYGVPSSVHCDYLAPVERRGFCIIGSNGNLGVDLVARTLKMTPIRDMVQFYTGKDSFDENYIEEMQAFIDLIDGKPNPYAATGEDGLHTLETILEAQRMAGVP